MEPEICEEGRKINKIKNLRSKRSKLVDPSHMTSGYRQSNAHQRSKSLGGKFESKEKKTAEQGCQTINPDRGSYEVHEQIKKFFSKGFMDELECILQSSLFSSKMLLNLVNDLLDLAKIEQNTFQFNEDYFDLNETIENAFNQCRYQADSKGI